MREYENILKTSDNRLKQRAYYIPENEGGYTLLNGEWNFKFFERDIDVPDEIDNWDKIKVPSCWQLCGYEKPNYTNVNFPYPVDPPYVPDENPCGVYKREFEIFDLNKKHYIVFEGVCSCVYLYINNKYVGFSQGSHLQAEFDISPFVKEGVNTITAKVLKWCVSSYLEDQDFFRYNGIFRDVYLLERPENHIKDIVIKTEKNKVKVDFEGQANIKLYDKDILLCEKECDKYFEFEIENAVLWNAEKPYLYTLKFEFEGEIITQKFGFVEIEISSEKELLINGESVKLKGVNHHDTHKENGWCMTDEEIYNDLLLMKKLNMNAVRTSHYPPTPKFLNFCDEIGLYVISECDMESHGFTQRLVDNENRRAGYDCEDPIWPCTNPKWEKELCKRMERCVLRDRNHPSIFMWSLGNESGYGINMRKMLEKAREIDPSRLTHAEGAYLSQLGEAEDEPTSVYSRMYTNIVFCAEYADNKENKQPMFLCEYCHTMGNGPGDVYDYVETMYAHKGFIGGCIWEWADHVVLEDGVQKYGGDFGEITHDKNFCCDGLVFADRSFKAGTYETKIAYQNIKTELKNNEIYITNRYDFTNLNEYKLKIDIEIDGKVIETKELVLDVKPKETAKIKLDTILPKSCKLGSYVNIYLYDNDGYEWAMSQHKLDVLVEKHINTSKLANLTEDKEYIYANGDGFSYRFSKVYGNFDSMLVDKKEKLAGMTKLTAHRAPTDNDRHIRFKWNTYHEKNNLGEAINRTMSKIYSCEIKEGRIFVSGSLSGVSRVPYFRYNLEVLVFEDGEIKFNLKGNVRENAIWLPRLGFEFKLLYNDDKFTYFAYGDKESYIDMHHHAKVGMYQSSADNEYVNYVYPQEHGNHYGAKMLDIDNSLKFVSNDTFEFNVSHYNSKALEEATHTNELVKDNTTNVRIDYKVSGIGSHSCGPELLEKYRFSEKEVNFEFCILKN